MIRPLSLDTLKELDPKAVAAFDTHLRRASGDCYDRPGDETPRKVVLEIALMPVRTDDMACDEVRSQVFISSSVPKHKTKLHSLGLKANGMLVFQEDAPDNVNQSTMLPDDE